MKHFILLILALSPLVFASQKPESHIDLWEEAVNRADYGEFCDNVEFVCNSTLGLICSNDVCDCLKPYSMTFDTDLLKCVSLVGGECHIEPPEDELEFYKTCAENSECSAADGICKCAYPFVAYADRRCRDPVLNLEYGQHCNSSHFCNFGSILLCKEETSSCGCTYEDTMAYDFNIKKCRSLADRNSSCYFTPIGGIFMECVPNALCFQDEDDPFGPGYCRCASGYVAYEDRFCKLPTIQHYGMSCNTSHVCDKTSILHCNTSDNKCGCIPYSGMFYEAESSLCVSGVAEGASCFMRPVDGVQRMCTKHAGCVPIADGMNIGFCSCSDSYVPYEDHTCGIPTFEQEYGERCNASTQCRSENLLSCDNTVDSCDCRYDGDVYETELKKCVSPAYGLCYSEAINGELRSCVSNSECQLVGEAGGKFGYCKCNIGYIADVNGQCIRMEGNLIGDSCSIVDPIIECKVENSECSETNETCNCLEGYTVSVEKDSCTKNSGATLKTSAFTFLCVNFILLLVIY